MVTKKDDFIRISVWLGFAVAAIGLAVLAGWALHLEYLTTPIPGYVSMKANTAISFICLGAALTIRARYGYKDNAVLRMFARVLALVAAALGTLICIEYVAGVDLGIDQLLFSDPEITAYSPFPGRMSPVTSLNFVLFGLGMFLYKKDRDRHAVNILTAIAGAFSVLGIIGAIYGVIPLVPLARYTQVAVHTSVAFVLLFLGIMFSQPDSGIMKIISYEGAAGLLARWLLPGVIVLELATGKLRLLLIDKGLVTREYGSALSTLVNVGFVIGLFVLAFRALKRSEEELRRHRERLEELVGERTAANRELEAFCYSVSHDLRAPLRSIDGFSKALMEDCPEKLGEKDMDSLNRVRAASQRMELLIDDLLKLSRMTRGEMRREMVDMSALARSVAAELESSQPGRDVEFAISDGLFADGDARLMRVAVENLLGNAWKFTSKRARAKIEFGVNEVDDRRVFFVKDDGAGFDMAYKDKLFGPFQRLHSATDFQGAGVGLATVQRIVARHGGRVWAEGEVDTGATFYFTLGQEGPAEYKEAA